MTIEQQIINEASDETLQALSGEDFITLVDAVHEQLQASYEELVEKIETTED